MLVRGDNLSSKMEKHTFLLLVMVLLVWSRSTMAEPGPDVVYVHEGDGTCGELWLGDEYTKVRPAEAGWKELYQQTGWNESVCGRIVAHLPQPPTRVADPCEYLQTAHGLTATSEVTQVCAVLGLEYVEIEARREQISSDAAQDGDEGWSSYIVVTVIGIAMLLMVGSAFWRFRKRK